jgi:serine/threonine protein kinase
MPNVWRAFQREAEVLAALNHTNIGGVYGLERTADFTALVMELVEDQWRATKRADRTPPRSVRITTATRAVATMFAW